MQELPSKVRLQFTGQPSRGLLCSGDLLQRKEKVEREGKNRFGFPLPLPSTVPASLLSLSLSLCLSFFLPRYTPPEGGAWMMVLFLHSHTTASSSSQGVILALSQGLSLDFRLPLARRLRTSLHHQHSDDGLSLGRGDSTSPGVS